jgi:hypothetical protein
MSLFKQLFIAICVLMLVNFTGSFLVSVESSREQQVNQLRAYAQLPSGSRARESGRCCAQWGSKVCGAVCSANRLPDSKSWGRSDQFGLIVIDQPVQSA